MDIECFGFSKESEFRRSKPSDSQHNNNAHKNQNSNKTWENLENKTTEAEFEGLQTAIEILIRRFPVTCAISALSGEGIP